MKTCNWCGKTHNWNPALETYINSGVSQEKTESSVGCRDIVTVACTCGNILRIGVRDSGTCGVTQWYSSENK